MSKNYYLISSLPELFFESEDVGSFDFISLRDYIFETASSNESRYVCDLLCGIDNYNLITAIYSKNRPWKEGGSFQIEFLNDLEEYNLPNYIRSFLDFITEYEEENKAKPNELAAEKHLFELCYNEMENSSNGFIAKWFKFDREIKNIQAAYVGRQLEISAEEYLIKDEEDDIAELLLKNNSPDFGLAKARDYIPKLFQALETEDLLDRENKIDMFRWNYIDELNTFAYFKIDAALGILQKAHIADRWAKLDEQKGKEMFKKLVNDLKNSYKEI